MHCFYLHEEKGILIGVIEVGRYGKLTRSSLAKAFGLNEILASVTFQVDNIQGNYDTLAATLALTKEEV